MYINIACSMSVIEPRIRDDCFQGLIWFDPHLVPKGSLRCTESYRLPVPADELRCTYVESVSFGGVDKGLLGVVSYILPCIALYNL